MEVADQIRDRVRHRHRVGGDGLRQVVKLFAAWKPEVDKLLTSVKLKLSKLNSFFDRDAKLSSASKPACYRSSRRSGVVMRDPAPTALMGTTLISATGIVGLGRDSPKS
jgi:hypothetical protein